MLAQRAAFLPKGVVGYLGLIELVPNFGEISLDALRSGCLVVGAGNRSSSTFFGFGPRGRSRLGARCGIIAFMLGLPSRVRGRQLLAQPGQLGLRLCF